MSVLHRGAPGSGQTWWDSHITNNYWTPPPPPPARQHLWLSWPVPCLTWLDTNQWHPNIQGILSGTKIMNRAEIWENWNPISPRIFFMGILYWWEARQRGFYDISNLNKNTLPISCLCRLPVMYWLTSLFLEIHSFWLYLFSQVLYYIRRCQNQQSNREAFFLQETLSTVRILKYIRYFDKSLLFGCNCLNPRYVGTNGWEPRCDV